MLTASLALGAMLAGCNFFDSRTEFKLATPAQMAGNGTVLIFKGPAESYTCPLRGGSVSFAADPQRDGVIIAVHFSYQRSSKAPRNDVVALTTQVGTLYISGQGEYSLVPTGAMVSWRSLRRLGARGEEILSKGGAGLFIVSRGPGHYLIHATHRRDQTVFTGTVIPLDGKIYLRQAVFTSSVASYSGESQHDCGNWNTAADATAALRRVEGAIPP